MMFVTVEIFYSANWYLIQLSSIDSVSIQQYSFEIFTVQIDI